MQKVFELTYVAIFVIIISLQLLANCCVAQLPANYDLRTLNLITAVKDQGNCGSCWAFATIASIESGWLKQGHGTYSLSEDNIIDCHLFDESPCYGGSYFMANALLSRHEGPLTTLNDPYSYSTQDCPMQQVFPPALPAFVEDMRFLPKDINTIKQTIYNYGAIATTMFFNTVNYNSITCKYYDFIIDANDSLYPHCVNIAGWSDTMTFPGAPANGGWIIKDSYGTSWGKNGYIYVSYYDAGILSESVFFPARYEVPPSQNRPHMYYYDTFGWVDNRGFNNNVAYGLAKFTISPTAGVMIPQQIKRFGTFAVEDNTILNIDIYKYFNSNILSGLILSKSLNCLYKGYYSIPVDMKTDTLGTTVYVRIKYQIPSGGKSPIPVETYEQNHTSGISLSQNSCWISADGSTWIPAGQGTSNQFDLCIKLYSEDASKAIISTPYDTLCLMQPAIINNLSTVPNDSTAWLVNNIYSGNMPVLNINFPQTGINTVKLVSYYGHNCDTAIQLFIVNPLPPVPLISRNVNSLFSTLATTYQWYDGNGLIPGATQQQFNPAANGNYYVVISDANGCYNTSAPYNFVLLNINESTENTFNIFPNPFYDYVYIENCNNPDIVHIKLSGIDGQLIFKGTATTLSAFNLKDLKPGIYFIMVTVGETYYVRKLVKTQ